jgi:hypothetical protein
MANVIFGFERMKGSEFGTRIQVYDNILRTYVTFVQKWMTKKFLKVRALRQNGGIAHNRTYVEALGSRAKEDAQPADTASRISCHFGSQSMGFSSLFFFQQRGRAFAIVPNVQIHCFAIVPDVQIHWPGAAI